MLPLGNIDCSLQLGFFKKRPMTAMTRDHGDDGDLPILGYNIPVDIYEEITRLRKEGRRGALATITNVRGSIPSFETAKMLVRDDGSIVGTIGGGCVEAEVWEAAREVMKTEKPQTLRFDLNNNPKYDTGLVCGGTLEVFVEPVLAVSTLYIFGAGHVAWSLYKVARMAGFDMRVLRWAAETPARYIGMIGSQRKTIAIYKELEKEGIAADKLARVYAPVGIDIGAITPEEIAISIVAELIAKRRGSQTPLPH